MSWNDWPNDTEELDLLDFIERITEALIAPGVSEPATLDNGAEE